MKRTKNKMNLRATRKLPKNLVYKIFGLLLDDLGCESVEYDGVKKALRSRDHLKLLDAASGLEPRCILQTSVAHKTQAFQFYRSYQVSAFLKKYPFPGVDTRKAALKKFAAGERACFLFNTENVKALLTLNESHPDFLGIVDDLREDIANLLGEYPNIDCVLANAKHGPGVSLGDFYKDGKTTSYYKWSQLPYTVTPGTLPYARRAIETDPRWIGALDDWYRENFSVPIGAPINIEHFWKEVFTLVHSNKITTVPKNALTDRTIAIEPLMNVFLQLGVDSFVRNRLKRFWNYDIDSQELNQILAKLGSIDGSYATIDLKNASETIALLLCELLLPPSWYDLLLDLRSPVGLVRLDPNDENTTRSVKYSKISSMGNGFTFALETLIFGAIVRQSMKRTESSGKTAVFGDDIVVPTSAFSYCIELLNLCGFSANVDKTFAEGPFRESCGKDFFLGMDVRPVFLKRQLKTLQDVFYLHNSLFSLQERLFWAWDVRFTKTLAYLCSLVPQEIADIYYGPIGESLDTHLFSERVLARNRWGQRCYNMIVPVARAYRNEKRFFFRKLMVSLKAKPKRQFWQPREIGTASGSAFDVTRQGCVFYVGIRCDLP